MSALKTTTTIIKAASRVPSTAFGDDTKADTKALSLTKAAPTHLLHQMLLSSKK